MVGKKPQCPERLAPELLQEVQRLISQQPWGPAVSGWMRDTGKGHPWRLAQDGVELW